MIRYYTHFAKENPAKQYKDYLLSYLEAATIGLVQPKKFLQPNTMRHEVTAYSISEGKLGMDISPSHMHFAKLIRILMNLVTLTIGNPRIFIEFGTISKQARKGFRTIRARRYFRCIQTILKWQDFALTRAEILKKFGWVFVRFVD